MVNRILSDEAGDIALSFAITAPLLPIAAGIGIDFQQGAAQRSRLQDAADTLALRGARELLLDNATAAAQGLLSGGDSRRRPTDRSRCDRAGEGRRQYLRHCAFR